MLAVRECVSAVRCTLALALQPARLRRCCLRTRAAHGPEPPPWMSALQQAAEEDDELAELLEASGNDAGVVEAKASAVPARHSRARPHAC